MCEWAVPLLAKVPVLSRSAGISTSSGREFSYAVQLLVRKKRRWDLASAVGLSYSELFDHCTSMLSNETDNLSGEIRATCHIAQLNLMARILEIDPSRSCLAAWESRKVITWSVEVAKTTLALPVFARKLESRLPSRPMDWYDGVMMTWADGIGTTAANHFSGPAVEAVECDLLFIIEVWSADALDSQLGKPLSAQIYIYCHKPENIF